MKKIRKFIVKKSLLTMSLALNLVLLGALGTVYAMNQSQLAKKVSSLTGGNFTKIQAEQCINATFDSIVDALKNGEKEVHIAGFGKFIAVNRAARKARNPQTNKEIIIPATRIIRFSSRLQL